MSEFGVSEKTARQCFNMFTINNTKELDFDYFVSLFEEYYLSDDPSDLGNFINGRLEYPDDDSSDAETHGKVQWLNGFFFRICCRSCQIPKLLARSCHLDMASLVEFSIEF